MAFALEKGRWLLLTCSTSTEVRLFPFTVLLQQLSSQATTDTFIACLKLFPNSRNSRTKYILVTLSSQTGPLLRPFCTLDHIFFTLFLLKVRPKGCLLLLPYLSHSLIYLPNSRSECRRLISYSFYVVIPTYTNKFQPGFYFSLRCISSYIPHKTLPHCHCLPTLLTLCSNPKD